MAGILAGVCILFSPTVILNGSVWAQCDSIFTFFCVLGVYYLAKKKDFLGAFYFSLGFCFKIQAMFLLPAIFIILCKRNPFKFFFAPSVISESYGLGLSWEVLIIDD